LCGYVLTTSCHLFGPRRWTGEAAERHARQARALINQQQKLVQLYYRNAISVELLQEEQRRIQIEQSQAEQWQNQAIARVEDVMEALDDALALMAHPGRAYDEAKDHPTSASSSTEQSSSAS
jgi:hypothetical protein